VVLLSEIVGKKFIIFKSLTKCIIGADSKVKQKYPKPLQISIRPDVVIN